MSWKKNNYLKTWIQFWMEQNTEAQAHYANLHRHSGRTRHCHKSDAILVITNDCHNHNLRYHQRQQSYCHNSQLSMISVPVVIPGFPGVLWVLLFYNMTMVTGCTEKKASYLELKILKICFTRMSSQIWGPEMAWLLNEKFPEPWSHYDSFQFNSLWPSDAIWQLRSGSTLIQVMAWCCQASDIHIRRIAQEIPQSSSTKISLKFTYVKFY